MALTSHFAVAKANVHLIPVPLTPLCTKQYKGFRIWAKDRINILSNSLKDPKTLAVVLAVRESEVSISITSKY